MHGVTVAEHDKPVPIAPDAEIKIAYKKTESGANWIQQTFDMKTGKQMHDYVKGKGRMKGCVPHLFRTWIFKSRFKCSPFIFLDGALVRSHKCPTKVVPVPNITWTR
jgi:hypothetical protein